MSTNAFQAVPITDRVHWVGAIDWTMREFHGYATPRGTTYNAYLVMADKPILVDTVRRPFFGEMLARIASVIDPSAIDTVISHHAELDHSGCLPEVTALAHPTRVLTSKAGVAALAGHFRLETPVEGVATGTTLDLGGARFTFSDTRMLHWPESMVSYLAGDDVLFSQDMFGIHLAGHERFADEVPADVIAHESAKYFANILLPFADAVTRVVGRLPDIAPGVRVVATDHGPVWRRDLDALARQYASWAARPPRPELVVVYDTMWESTAAMARALAEGAYTAGVKVQVMRAGQTHRSDLATALLTAGGLAVGSPVLNGQLFPTIADVLCYVRGLKPRGLVTGIFGSYGWSAAPFEQIQVALDEIKGTAAAPPLLVKFVPQDDDFAHCRALGATMAGRILEACRVVRQPGQPGA